jgi:hypothetical protein
MVGPVWHTKIGVSGPLSAKLLSYAGLICAAADPRSRRSLSEHKADT